MWAWILPIISHWSIKTVAVILAIVLVIGGAIAIYRNIDGVGYQRGYSQSLKDHPQNIYNGPSTINQQPCQPPSVFGLDFGKWAFGLVHKK